MTRAELKAWRLARNLTIADAAAKVGVHWTTWARWEGGVRQIPAMLDVTLKGLRLRCKPRA